MVIGQIEAVRSDWTRGEIAELFDLPFTELLFRAATVHHKHHDPVAVQRSTLLSIKTGGCPEDCGYCNQSASAETGLKVSKLMDVRAVLRAAAQAHDNGSTRFCMGAAWREPKDKDIRALAEMIRGVRQMGMGTCMTLGMLTPSQAEALARRDPIITTIISIRAPRITLTSSRRARSRTGSTRSGASQ